MRSITLLLLVLLMALPAAAQPADLDALLFQGEDALRSGDPVAAMRAFREALDRDGESWSAHDGMGRAWRATGDLEAAERELRHAVTLAPPGSPAPRHLADLIVTIRDEQRRREGRAWLAEHASGSLEIQIRVARESRVEGDLLTAGAALKRALALDPDSMEALIEEIRVHRDSLDYDRAEELAKAFMRRYPRYAETHLQLGRIYQLQDRLEEGAAQYETALELDPEHPTALHRLGEIRLKQGNLDAAAKLLERAVIVAPQRYQAHYLLGKVYLRKGDKEAAARELETFRRIKDELRAHTRLAGGAAMGPD